MPTRIITKEDQHTFKTAEHFVQPIYLPEEIIDSTLYNTPDDENGSGAILIMEYFQRCELHDLLARINDAASNNWRLPYEQARLEFIPTRILWRLFLCLTKTCVGMAYPPPPEYYGRPPVYREAIIPDLYPEPIIHFDLHPLNVFIDDPVRTWDYIQEHGLGPRFKLGDFSLTQAWDTKLNDEAKIAAANVGKPGYRAPEQLTRDRIVEPYAFGPHTNIWGIGWLMYNALTLYYTDDLDWTPEVCPITLPNGEPYNLNTWAPFLVGNPARVYPHFATYSIELRTLIARCMADRQEDRPSLEELMRIIYTNIREGTDAAVEAQMQFEDERLLDPTKEKLPVDVTAPPPVEDDELLERFWAEYLREPPIKEDPYREFWAEDLINE
ncbi:hypothetical protein Hte_007018 [Hypoxylon texense]